MLLIENSILKCAENIDTKNREENTQTIININSHISDKIAIISAFIYLCDFTNFDNEQGK